MKKRWTIAMAVAICAVGVCGFVMAFVAFRGKGPFSPDADRLLLLLPDGANFSDPRVTVWLDAANEEGLHVVPTHDSTFLRPLFGRPKCVGVILPDTTHVQASELLLDAIRDYVAKGGKLMLVYDAGTKSLQGFYPGDRSRLSDLAGINYALYRSLGAGMIQSSDVSGAIFAMHLLGIPPGKYFPLGPLAGSDALKVGAVEATLRRYEYGDLEYPSFVTSGTYAGKALLHSKAGLVAGYQRYKRGSVLFVNLPLGYLEGYTDGLPLHAFLKYFAVKMLSLPYLMSVPDGVGGLVLDWHIDSNAAIEPLEEMNTWTIMKQGPYSLDITAGPDANGFGDKEGFNVLHNPVSQGLVREYLQLGYEIGSHGGWIHNYFGGHVNDNNGQEMEQFLQLNKSALEKMTGKPVREYSAPIGNHPQWVTSWLEQHGVVAYYFTGDTGMGPTLGYRRGQRAGQKIWAFPILHLDRAATFEEMPKYGYSDAIVGQWLDEATDFTVNQRQVRLIYFHPPGILRYHRVVDEWMEKTAQLKAQDVFRWYTMPQMADFLNVRKTVKWKLTEHGNSAFLDAFGPQTLNHQTWRLPKDTFGAPRVIKGIGRVVPGSDSWFVIAGPGTHLEIEAALLDK